MTARGATSPVEEENALLELNRLLARVGRLPRWISIGVLVAGAVVGVIGWLASGDPSVTIIVTGAPLAFVLSSLPVRARATSDALIVHSYLQKHVIPFREVLVFTDLPYSGMWNRSAGTDSWLNLGLRMIDVTRNSGTGFSMPATMTSRRTCGQIVAALNAHVERRHESSL